MLKVQFCQKMSLGMRCTLGKLLNLWRNASTNIDKKIFRPNICGDNDMFLDSPGFVRGVKEIIYKSLIYLAIDKRRTRVPV